MKRRWFVKTAGLGAASAAASGLPLAGHHLDAHKSAPNDASAGADTHDRSSLLPKPQPVTSGGVWMITQSQFGLQGARDFDHKEPFAGVVNSSLNLSSDIRAYPLRMRQWSSSDDHVSTASLFANHNSMYELLFPFDNLADQLESEVMPLRIVWAQSVRESALDPKSQSWQRFRQLYSYQFEEEKTVALFAPELSFKGDGSIGTQYDFGRYLRIVYLYVKPERITEFEDFAHRFIVPAATQVLHLRDQVVHAPPSDQRVLYRLPTHIRRVSINVNMPTIPEFELFVQRYLVKAAKETNTALLTYRTVTGNRNNYHIFYPFNDAEHIHYDNKTLMATSLLREHLLQTLALNGEGAAYIRASYSPGGIHKQQNATALADELAEQFHSHAIEIEEVVSRVRPDMAAALDGRFTQSSISYVKASVEKSM